MSAFSKRLLSSFARPHRRHQTSSPAIPSIAESLEHRVVLSAVAGEALLENLTPPPSGREIQIHNSHRVRVDGNGDLVVTAGQKANNRQLDRFEVKTAGTGGVGGEGAAQIWVNGKLVATVQTRGDEITVRIEGSKDADRVDASDAPLGIKIVADGRGGHDTLIGGRGDDQLLGGNGNDVLRGGQGNDQLEGGDGNDQLHGNEGDDRLLGNDGSDTAEGGAGDDFLADEEYYGGTGRQGSDRRADRNVLRGGDGNDALSSGRYAIDQLFGDSGNDRLTAHGQASLYGGEGNDLLSAHTPRSAVLLNGGDGDDILSARDNDLGASTINAGQPRRDQILRGIGNDTLIGGAGTDQFFVEYGDLVKDLESNELVTNDDQLIIIIDPGRTTPIVSPDQSFLARLIGMDLPSAETLIRDSGLISRVVSRDGISAIVTMDYRLDRVNLVVVQDLVTGARVG